MKGIYIHIPFCRQKCKYCDFVSYTGKESLADDYINALKREAERYRGEDVDTIFIGGGTPSVLSSEQIGRITKMCFDMFKLSSNYEFTIEANPGTLDDVKIKAMLDGGINRISVGVQSFNDNELKKIGRIHDSKMAYNTICHLNKMGFSNINIDLMTALPEQTHESLKNTLEKAVSLPITHISAYSLIIEDGTPLENEYSKGLLELPDEDTDREMYDSAVCFLGSNGFSRYEISNFAKKGFECRHNIKYWQSEDYIGLGVAAHSCVGDKRFCNTSDICAYLNDAPMEITLRTEKDKISEFMITGLRMCKGISKKTFKKRFGVEIETLFGDELKRFTELQMMKFDGENYSLTAEGINVSNSILCEFV